MTVNGENKRGELELISKCDIPPFCGTFPFFNIYNNNITEADINTFSNGHQMSSLSGSFETHPDLVTQCYVDGGNSSAGFGCSAGVGIVH